MVSHGSLRRRNWPSGRWTFMAPSWTPSPNPTDCPALSRPASKLGSSSPQRSLSSTLARCDTPSAPAVAADSTVPLCAPGSATISTVTRVSQRRTAILMDTKCDHKNHNCVLIATAIPISSVMRKLEQLQARTARTASGRGARTLNQHFAVASKKNALESRHCGPACYRDRGPRAYSRMQWVLLLWLATLVVETSISTPLASLGTAVGVGLFSDQRILAGCRRRRQRLPQTRRPACGTYCP